MTTSAAIVIRDIRLVNIGLEDALNAIDAALVSRVPVKIAFVNADCINIAAHNMLYREHIKAMDWVFIDGVGMKIAGKILQQPVHANVNGTDLFPLLCEDFAKKHISIYLLGAKPGVAEAAAHWAQTHYPGLRVAGHHDGYFGTEQTPEVLAAIRASQADVLLVAMGVPRQEAWIHQHQPATGVTVALGVGGLFDFYSGNIPRAPQWMRDLGFEWSWRLWQEPGRLWRRYLLGNWSFLARIATDRLLQHFRSQRT